MKSTKEKRMMDILFNLGTLKKDFENFRDWDTSDEDNWEAMISLIEIVEEQVNQIA